MRGAWSAGRSRRFARYLGLDPRVRQSGAAPATHGHISKQGSVSARHALVEACWSTVRQPGPIAGFYQGVRARRGPSIAIVASARKLACLFWCQLTRGEDDPFAQPSLTTKKMRRLELQAGAPRYQDGHGMWSTNDAMRHAECELALQAQRAYKRTVKDWQQKKGATATPGRASSGSSKNRSRGRPQGPSLRFDSSSLAPSRTVPRQAVVDQPHLTYTRRPTSSPTPRSRPRSAG